MDKRKDAALYSLRAGVQGESAEVKSCMRQARVFVPA